jgi:hypothetical protein
MQHLCPFQRDEDVHQQAARAAIPFRDSMRYLLPLATLHISLRYQSLRCHGFQEDVHFISRTPFPRATGLCHSSPLAPVFERHPDLTGGF